MTHEDTPVPGMVRYAHDFGLSPTPPNENDARKMLSNWYGEEAIYADTVELTPDGRSGLVRMIVRPEQCDRSNEPSFRGMILGVGPRSILTELRTTPAHAKGHFKDGLPSVLPGHKSIRAAVEAAGQLYNKFYVPDGNSGVPLRIRQFDSVIFKKVIRPGQEIRVEFTLDDEATADWFKGKATVRLGDEEAVVIEGLVCELSSYEDDGLREDQLIEAWAQAAGMAGLTGQQQRGGVPLFESIGPTIFDTSSAPIKPGETLITEINIIERPKQGLIGTAFCVKMVDGKPVGVVASKNLKARILTEKQARFILRPR